jgi:luciferase family oxidoreductase group 1
MSRPYRLSVLDQSPVAEGSTTADALANTLDLARLCDRLGYHRYWLAEHHASYGVAGAAPEALIGPVALQTKHIRVGSGGIMLPHYSPFKVAETFRLLAALAPGRIDLGIGRAPGTDGKTAFALQRDRSRVMPSDFPEQLAELLAYLGDTMPEKHAFAGLVQTLPSGGQGSPAPWLLGSSMDSAIWAAETGLPYCFADFINSDGAAMTSAYRNRFRPSAWLAEPYVAVGVWTIAASSREEAEDLATPSAMMFDYLIRGGRQIPVPSVETALAWRSETSAGSGRRRQALGTPAEVRSQLDAVAALYEADEVLLVNIMHDHATRLRSYALVAEEYGLALREQAA